MRQLVSFWRKKEQGEKEKEEDDNTPWGVGEANPCGTLGLRREVDPRTTVWCLHGFPLRPMDLYKGLGEEKKKKKTQKEG